MPIKEKSQKEIIKEICIEFECTQIELAKKIGVSVNTVNQWSMGRSNIPKHFFKTIDFIRDVRKFSKELQEKHN